MTPMERIPLNRSSRREEALTSFARDRMSLVTSAATRFMRRGQRATGRFMGREHLQILDVSWGHEPETRKLLRIKASVFRFMGSLHALSRMHWDHESNGATNVGQASRLPSERVSASKVPLSAVVTRGRRDACPTLFQALQTGRQASVSGRRVSTAAFSLVEVMVALAIFFMAVFTILGLLSTVLNNARALQNRNPADAGMVAAYLLSVTNRLEETLQSGTFEDFGDFGGNYSNYEWTFDAREIETNGLWRVDCIVQRRPGGQVESQLSFFVFSPQSQGSLSGRGGGLRP